MNEKLTLQDLVDLLAKKAGITKKDAEAFFREFFAVITDNIFNNDIVKIKNFGTFKLTKVSSRESVDVNTGEKIEIPAHFKLSFLPDKSLKNIVNKPFAQFETTLLEDGVEFERIEISEEPADTMEDEDTGADEPDVIKAVEETKPVFEQKEEKFQPAEGKGQAKKEKVSKLPTEKESESKEVSPTFNYTYNVVSTDEPDSVTLVLPTSQLIFKEENKKEEVHTEPEPTTVEPKQDIITKEDTDDREQEDENDELNDDFPLEINKVQEQIDQLKEAIDALAKEKRRNKKAIDKETVDEETKESKQQEETIMPPVLPPYDEFVSDKEEDTYSSAQNTTSDSTNTGIVYEDVTEEIYRDTRGDNDLLASLKEFDTNTNTTTNATQNNIEADKKEDNDTEETDDDDYEFYDYNQDSSWDKFRKKLPIIIFLLVIIAFGVYQFAKLFENKNGYTKYNRVPTYVENDSLSSDKDIINTDSSANIIQQPSNGELVSGITKNDSINIITEEQSDTIKKGRSYDKVISDNLKIKILRKATDKLEKGEPAQVNVKEATEIVKSGATLRTLSIKYYGSNIFWVYIYEDNKSKIRDFDNLSIGMKLSIPDLKKYGTGINDPKAAEKAKNLEREIMNRR
ncbi:MAG: HU family DNA-binding protein [Dysgonomonas sp.]